MASLRTLTAILSYAIALCGIVPLYAWLTPLPRVLLAACMAAGIWQDRRGAWPLKNWMLNISIVPVFILYAARFSRANAVQPVVSVLAVMLAIRLLGEKNDRHYLQIYALSLFCLSASSLFDLSPLFVAYLAVMLFMVAVSLVLLTFHGQGGVLVLSSGDLRRVLAAGLVIPLASVPLLVFFFPLLPRTQLPLWNIIPAPAVRPVGFSKRVEPGTSAVAADSRALAFRAELPRQPEGGLYWRGTVFNRLDGQRWVRDMPPPEQTVFGAVRVAQVIYPEPGSGSHVFALDAPAAISRLRTARSPDGVYELTRGVGSRNSYAAESVSDGLLPVTGGIDRAFYLRLPKDVPERIMRLAWEIGGRGGTDSSRLELLERHFRNGGYRYAMRGLPTGSRALERFLFETRQGHCEFFASAFAIVARAAGVPARLVGGYLGGEYNDLGGYYLVTENMAHVWVEAFVEGQGWVRIDPSGFAENAGAVLGGSGQQGVLLRLRLAMDALNHAWNRSVISYDFERQVDAARTAGRRLQRLEAGRVIGSLAPLLLALLVPAAGFFLFLNRRRFLPSPEERLLRAFYYRIEKDGGIRVERGRQGLFEIAEACGSERARLFAGIYCGAVYRDRRLSPEEVRRLKELIRAGFGAAPASHSD